VTLAKNVMMSMMASRPQRAHTPWKRTLTRQRLERNAIVQWTVSLDPLTRPTLSHSTRACVCRLGDGSKSEGPRFLSFLASLFPTSLLRMLSLLLPLVRRRRRELRIDDRFRGRSTPIIDARRRRRR
jgi:hypothetical protein